MKFLSKTKYFLLFSLLLFGSCEEEIDSEALVFTEDVIFVSGEILRVTGRVVSSGQVMVSDHGFQIADNPEFNSPIIISLGERDIPGRFIGEHESLNTETDFFVRAFMVNEGASKFGAAVEFSTLSSQLTEYSPSIANVNAQVSITGQNLTTDVEVFFGNVKAEIIDFKFESVLRVRVPTPLSGEFVVPLRVISDGKELIYDENFEYIIGKWESISTFPGDNSFSRNAFFQDGGKFYAGINEASGGDPQSFWSFDPLSNQWDLTDFPGSFVRDPGSFNGGILGGSFGPNGSGGINISNEFWLFESNQFVSQGTLPFSLARPVTFKEGNDLFVFGGLNTSSTASSLVWRYDFNTGNWDQYDTAPIEIRNNLPSFRHDGLMYFIGPDKAMVRYDPATKTWTNVGDYPGQRIDLALGVTIGEFGYVGLSSQERTMFAYEFSTNTWREKVALPGFNQDISLGYYVFDEKLYVFRSNVVGTLGPQMWVFEPFNF